TFAMVGDTLAGGAIRNNIAAVSTASGLPTAWDPDARIGANPFVARVGALLRDGSTIYVGGVFSFIGGEVRNNLAAIDAGTGLAAPWNPSPLDSVSALAI